MKSALDAVEQRAVSKRDRLAVIASSVQAVALCFLRHFTHTRRRGKTSRHALLPRRDRQTSQLQPKARVCAASATPHFQGALHSAVGGAGNPGRGWGAAPPEVLVLVAYALGRFYVLRSVEAERGPWRGLKGYPPMQKTRMSFCKRICRKTSVENIGAARLSYRQI